jgi:hypothetical protein
MNKNNRTVHFLILKEGKINEKNQLNHNNVRKKIYTIFLLKLLKVFK